MEMRRWLDVKSSVAIGVVLDDVFQRSSTKLSHLRPISWPISSTGKLFRSRREGLLYWPFVSFGRLHVQELPSSQVASSMRKQSSWNRINLGSRVKNTFSFESRLESEKLKQILSISDSRTGENTRVGLDGSYPGYVSPAGTKVNRD